MYTTIAVTNAGDQLLVSRQKVSAARDRAAMDSDLSAGKSDGNDYDGRDLHDRRTERGRRVPGGGRLPQALGREHRLLKGIATSCADLLTWDDLNEILSTHRLEFPRLRLSANGDAVPMEAYTRRVVTRRRTTWSELRPALLHQRLAEGDTLVLDSLDELHPMTRRLAVALEGLFRTHVQINAYASWTGQNGFATHGDDHDVAQFELDGSKRWTSGPTRGSSAPPRRGSGAGADRPSGGRVRHAGGRRPVPAARVVAQRSHVRGRAVVAHHLRPHAEDGCRSGGLGRGRAA